MSEYALSWSKQTPRLISGGSDSLVVMWDLRDAESAALQSSLSSTLFQSKVGSSETDWGKKKILKAKRKFRGHEDVVEDVAHHPKQPSASIFASVSDDRSLIIWDARLPGNKRGDGIATRFKEAHSDDINCVDWNLHDENKIVTGSSDGTVNIYDYRMLGKLARQSIIRSYGGQSSTAEEGKLASSLRLGNITNVMWSPTDSRFFATAGDDGIVSVWDSEKSGAPSQLDGLPEGLFFRHTGHRASVVDFDWNTNSPWTFASISDDSQNPHLGGGTLQVWRISDLLYKSQSLADPAAESEWKEELRVALAEAEKEDADRKRKAATSKAK